MFVGSPFGEPRKVLEDLIAVGMKDMGTILVDQDPRCVISVIGVTAHMWSPVDKEHTLIAACRIALRKNRAGETGADDSQVEGLYAR